MAVALAAQMLLVQRRLEDLWWWSWTFAILEAATALVFLLGGLSGLPDGAPAWPWWLLAGANGAVFALDLAGLAKAGTERSPV
jgi:hypothetical protein